MHLRSKRQATSLQMLNSSVDKPQNPEVLEDFNKAIDRLVVGKPNNSSLKQKAARGALKLNFSTVAKEACHSRTLIGKEVCAYPQIRTRVLELMNPVVSPTDSNSVITCLRSDNKELRQKLANALNEGREQLSARQAAERDGNRWREAYQDQLQINSEHDNGAVLRLVSLRDDV